jgi:phosphate acyltransferase
MRIALDVMGGDHGCQASLGGALQALDSLPGLGELFLVGNEAEIRPALDQRGRRDDRLKVVHASEVLTMEDKPLEAVRKKKDSSMLRAIELVRDGKADAIISQGNTGALVAAATLRLKRLEDVERPVIAVVMPSLNREFVLLDAGANSECKPEHLVQFAVMGGIYSREILGRENPRVGVLCNGTEESKGNELTRQTSELLRQSGLNYIGYVEGFDLFNDRVEVVVADGFVGNIVLKSCEGLGRSVGQLLKRELSSTPLGMLGAFLAGRALRRVKRRMNPDAYGGAPILGLNGNVIKAHGSAREEAIFNAIRVAGESVRHHLKDHIIEEIARVRDALAASPAAPAMTQA